MDEPLALAGLACADGDWPVALCGDGLRGAARWRHDVACAAATLARLPGPSVALHETDAYRFSVWLFGAWHAGRTVLLPGDDSAAMRAAVGDAPRIAADADWPQQPVALTPLGEAQLVLFTSGSTGTPVAAPKRLTQLTAEVATLARTFDLPPTAPVVGSVPPHHCYGLLFRVLWPLAARRPFVAATLAYPEMLQALVPDGRCVLVASPALLTRLPTSTAWPPAGIAAVFSSGGPLATDAARAAAGRLGTPVHEVYGSTETGGIAWRADPAAPWQPLAGVSVTIDDGLLAVRSPFLPDAAARSTGDRAEADGDGFRLLGRADRIVKLEENRISLTQVEAALLLQPEVAAARVLPLPGTPARLGAALVLTPHGGQALAAQGKAMLARGLRERLAQVLAPPAVPRRWRLVDALPQDAMGKVTVQALAALFDGAPALPYVLDAAADGEAVTLRCHVDATLAPFAGHFPELPVLPGVALIDWAVHYGRRHFALPPDCTGMQAIKFQRAVRPGAVVSLRLAWLPGRGQLTFEYHAEDGTPHAGGRLYFAQEPQ
ncbi:AMP-binding protein [Chitiniphilus purpureus]|uniref:AMP-binding protein n=1 Tax=Chitiniphilus purpureus TaxID=2981137 RepID=A0ABY6DPQ6_9NEIS|nr:AMP-binding protein [Chitiniphilus sp. CD1]UXY16007.1 AMP-binding protein [Chitiniphilus sp. CD1]